MKALLGLTILALFTSCGKVETPQEAFDFLDHDKVVNDVDNLDDRVNEVEQRLSELEESIYYLYDQVNDLNVDQDTLEQSIALINVNIVTLEQKITVTELIDPCGDNPNQFDEKLIKLSSGQIVAYFEQGGKRFLTDLVDGNYRTTDSQRCNFQIVNGQYQE